MKLSIDSKKDRGMGTKWSHQPFDIIPPHNDLREGLYFLLITSIIKSITDALHIVQTRVE